MLVRLPVRGQTKWFLRRLPVQVNGAARQRDRLCWAVLCWLVGCLGREMLGKGVLAPPWPNIRIHEGCSLKRAALWGTRYPGRDGKRSVPT